MLYLLQDYWENGLYTNSEQVVECNGMGEIQWDQTINESFALIQRNRPHYLELQTKKTKVDDYDYFKRLHECILSEISNELKNTKEADDPNDLSLLELFEIEEIELSEESRDLYGENEYILYRLEKELNVQFNTKKQNILKGLYTYVSQKVKFDSVDCMSLYGTNSFHKVWEDVCASIFDNQLKKPLCDLPLAKGLDESFSKKKDSSLLDIIEKPYWDYICGFPKGEKGFAKETLEPDIIAIDGDQEQEFIIIDAKYYTPIIEREEKMQMVPGIGDIAKQYLYQLAYKGFLEAHSITRVFNCFVMPIHLTDETRKIVVSKGNIILDFMLCMGLEKIQVRMLSAEEAFKYYLAGKKMSIDELELEQGVSYPSIASEHIKETYSVAAENADYV